MKLPKPNDARHHFPVHKEPEDLLSFLSNHHFFWTFSDCPHQTGGKKEKVYLGWVGVSELKGSCICLHSGSQQEKDCNFIREIEGEKITTLFLFYHRSLGSPQVKEGNQNWPHSNKYPNCPTRINKMEEYEFCVASMQISSQPDCFQKQYLTLIARHSVIHYIPNFYCNL